MPPSGSFQFFLKIFSLSPFISTSASKKGFEAHAKGSKKFISLEIVNLNLLFAGLLSSPQTYCKTSKPVLISIPSCWCNGPEIYIPSA